MALIKYIDPLSHQKSLTDNPIMQIKISSKGLIGKDRTDFVKRAGGVFDDIKITELIKPGEVAVHIIALGCDEYYGPNRNGDAFTKEACVKYHSTFKKLGHWFRNHDHLDPARSYGIVKASAFNLPLGRIELIIALNGTKEAAQRNGGLVAELEVDKLAKGEDLPVSMACKVAYDQCSGCGNKARNRDEYCTEEKCKYGGLKKNIGKTFDDGHTLRAFNPQPYFFDISYVSIPADRIAYSLGQIKVGSFEGNKVPLWVYREPAQDEVIDQLYWLGKLAYYELQANRGFIDNIQPKYLIKLANTEKYEINELVHELTKNDILLSPKDFLMLFADLEEKKAQLVTEELKPHLRTIFMQLRSDPNITKILSANIFFPREPLANEGNIIINKTAKINLPKQNSFIPTETKSIILMNQNIKKLATLYALYELASLVGWQGINPKEMICKQIIAINSGE